MGDLTVWRNGVRITVTDKQHGVVATGKATKAGVKVDSIKDESLSERVNKLFDMVQSKL